MRSFPTRLVSSVTWFFLLVSCLLVCLSCATPFPVEDLAEGMTQETVRERFGEPEGTESPQPGRSSWIYTNEEQNWIATLIPLSPVFIPLFAAIPGVPWDAWYVHRRPVYLDFEEERLVDWTVVPVVHADVPADPVIDWSKWPHNPNADPPWGVPGCRIRGEC
jgi:hypothetical protein